MPESEILQRLDGIIEKLEGLEKKKEEPLLGKERRMGNTGGKKT